MAKIYQSLQECVQDLEQHDMLIRIKESVDPDLEIAQFHRDVYDNKGPALFFENVKGSPFPVVTNLFGTMDRTRFIFRNSESYIKPFFEGAKDPFYFLKNIKKAFYVGLNAKNVLPKKISSNSAPVLKNETTIDQLPGLKSWPLDAGKFVTLPQVYSEDIEKPGIFNSNIGMYRVQLDGNEYQTNQEIGLHYQIHRGIGVHHSKCIAAQKEFKVCVFVGGPPAHTMAAVMPLPEGLPEVLFAGLLSKKRFRYTSYNGFTISADADFCIIGTISNEKKPEGPFGDHLGYYSLKHLFPYLKVEKVFHRDDAIWPATVVGRPPQEDTSFGEYIHYLTNPVIPKEIPGVKDIHAVDASGVHPLLLAIGKERYTPYDDIKRPQELLTIAHAILGKGQLSLAKYLFIANESDAPQLNTHDIREYFIHFLERVDFSRDLHFITNTTIDTLDYSGDDINCGSKLIAAAVGDKARDLWTQVPSDIKLPEGFNNPQMVIPGVLSIECSSFLDYIQASTELHSFTEFIANNENLDGLPLIILTEDSSFLSKTLNNFLWVTFTRSDPARDIYGVNSFTHNKHWGCKGSLIIDARIKPHHAPPLIEDQRVVEASNTLMKKYNIAGGS